MKLLSKMNRDELWAFWLKFQRGGSRKDAEALLGGRYKGYTTEAASLASYACNRAVMMDCRKRGDKHATKVYQMAAECCLEGLSVTALKLVYSGTGT